jgi:Mg2+/Co2+ transporter CorB
VLEVASTRNIDDVLVDMRRSRTHLGVVVGEDHETLGLVTLEDVLEELVGEIRDESDRGVRTAVRRRTARCAMRSRASSRSGWAVRCAASLGCRVVRRARRGRSSSCERTVVSSR